MKHVFMAILCMALLLGAPSAAPAETQATIRVDQTLESAFLTLHLNADAPSLSKGTPLTIYETSCPPLDAQGWTRVLLGEETDAQADADGKSLSVEDGERFAKYHPEEARFGIRYSAKDYTELWGYEQINQQAAGLSTTPAQALDEAQAWIDRFHALTGWDGFVLGACHTMPSEKEWLEAIVGTDEPAKEAEDTIAAEGFYVVEYVKKLDGYTVAYDQSPYMDDRDVFTKGDHIQLFIDDDGIGLAAGYGRSYSAKETTSLQITLDEAIDILRESMDYAECYPDEMPCEITEISLCYRLVQTLPVSNENAAIQMEARPAWRFAAGINRWNQRVFFLFVDAVTGEVLP